MRDENDALRGPGKGLSRRNRVRRRLMLAQIRSVEVHRPVGRVLQVSMRFILEEIDKS